MQLSPVWFGFNISVGLITLACGPGSDKPVETPHPVEGDCVIDRTQAQLDCVRKAPTSSAADVCIADVKARKDCVDGGAK